MSGSSTDTATCAFPWDAIDAPLADTAVVHGPLFTRPLSGAPSIRRYYEASHAVAGPVKILRHLPGGDEDLVIGEQLVEGRAVHSGFWLRRDVSGSVTEISHGMRPFALLPPYNDAMRRDLAGLVSDLYWELDDGAAVVVGRDEASLLPSKLADNARLFSPVLAKLRQGQNLVASAVAATRNVLGPRRVLAQFSAPGAFGVVSEIALDGHLARTIFVVFTDPAGAATDIIACMLPFPTVALLYDKMKAIAGERLGPDYFPI